MLGNRQHLFSGLRLAISIANEQLFQWRHSLRSMKAGGRVGEPGALVVLAGELRGFALERPNDLARRFAEEFGFAEPFIAG